MKKVFVLAFLLIGLWNVKAYSQETENKEITDEEIRKFATMEDSVRAFQEMKVEEISEMIKNHEVIDAGRYNDIKGAWGNEEKLTELKLKPEEKAAYEGIINAIASISDEAKELKISLIKDEEYLGVPIFNKVNKAIKENPEIKEKVDSLIAELKEKRSSLEGTDPEPGV